MRVLVAPGSLVFGGAAEVGGCVRRGLARYADVGKGPIEGHKACFVQFNVDSVSRMNLLDIRFVAVTRRVKGGSPKRLGQISGQALVMVNMHTVFEWVRGLRVLQAQFMPASRERKNPIKSPTVLVK